MPSIKCVLRLILSADVSFTTFLYLMKVQNLLLYLIQSWFEKARYVNIMDLLSCFSFLLRKLSPLWLLVLLP